MIRGSILFITGAGASADSGLPTYRGKDGVYENGGCAEIDLGIKMWKKNPHRVWEILYPLIIKVQHLENKVNSKIGKSVEEGLKQIGKTYQLMYKLSEGHVTQIYTQNIDGFSNFVCDDVWEMHGNLETAHCEHCEKDVFIGSYNSYTFGDLAQKCKVCYSVLKPNIVFYGEDIRDRPFRKRFFDNVIVIGTTLQFHYLKNMIVEHKSRGAKIIHINPDKQYVGEGEIHLRMNAEEGLKWLMGK